MYQDLRMAIVVHAVFRGGVICLMCNTLLSSCTSFTNLRCYLTSKVTSLTFYVPECVGILSSASESYFSYNPGESFSSFYDPSFIPMFEPTFEDSTLEKEAKEVCGDDEYCLFDIAATKKVEIGMATMEGGQNFEAIVEMSVPSTFKSTTTYLLLTLQSDLSCQYKAYLLYVSCSRL